MSKVLVLDDNPDMCQLMKEVLEDFTDVEVKLAHSYEEVVGHLSGINQIDLAFLDVNLGLNARTGIDVYQWLKDNQFTGKIIFFTGHAGTYPLLTELIKLPQVYLLEKPVNIEMIEKVFRE